MLTYKRLYLALSCDWKSGIHLHISVNEYIDLEVNLMYEIMISINTFNEHEKMLHQTMLQLDRSFVFKYFIYVANGKDLLGTIV